MDNKFEYVGYVLNEEGNYLTKIFLNPEPNNLANFIARMSPANKFIITDLMDLTIFTGWWNIIDKAYDRKLRDEVVNYLFPVQIGEEDPFEKELDYNFGSEEDGITEEVIDEYKRILRKDFEYIL